MPAIDGLASGLDTTAIVAQLMQLERLPQARLQTRQAAAQSALGSLRTLNTMFLGVLTAADKLGGGRPADPASTTRPPAWQLATATSSDSARVAVSSVTGAPAATLTFSVRQLATAGSALSDAYVGRFAAVPAQLLLGRGGAEPVAIRTGGTLAGAVDAINAAGAGVTAGLVQVTAPADGAEPEYRLQLTSTRTGADSGVSLRTTADPAVELLTTTVVAARDAVLDLGGGLTVRRPTNTISDLLDGVTLTLQKADTPASGGGYVEPPVTLGVRRDVEGIGARVQALVDAANSARNEARSLTAVDPVSGVKGRLHGDSTTRGLVDLVRGAFSADSSTLARLGITVDRAGTVSLDRATLRTALEADPAAVEAALGRDGLAGRLHAVADTASRSSSSTSGPGLIPAAIASRERSVTALRNDIAGWDRRLEVKQRQLQRQFTALESALGRAQSQGQWLAGQLAGLPKAGGTS